MAFAGLLSFIGEVMQVFLPCIWFGNHNITPYEAVEYKSLFVRRAYSLTI